MPRPPESGFPGFLTLVARGTSPGAACGVLRRNRKDLREEELAGSILVAERTVPDDIGRILASGATITLGGAALSHVSLLSREFGKPSISFGSGSRVRLLPEGGTGLLELRDVVGSRASPVLEEGDVVLLDAERGTLQVPGGLDRQARTRLRALHDQLVRFAKHPEDERGLGEISNASAGPTGAELLYALEAAFMYGLIPAGLARRRLADALRMDPSTRASAMEHLEHMRARVLEATITRRERALDVLRASEDTDELDRVIRDLERWVAAGLGVLEDLGFGAEGLDGALDPVRRQAALRREAVEARLRTETCAALALPEEVIRERAGEIFRLLRRARAAVLEDEATRSLEMRLLAIVAAERARVAEELVVRLDGSAPRDRSLVGGKAAGLLETLPYLPPGCGIPRGFIVTTSAYRMHLLGEVGEHLKEALREGGDEAQISRLARAALLSGAIPEEVREAVAAALPMLGSARLAVRSSATLEDGTAGSLAGQFDSYLGLRKLSEVLNRIRWAWASLWNARALATLNSVGLSPLGASQAVLVQELVETRAAGVLLSRDPSGSPDTVFVNAAWGLGEGISQGEVPGDLYWVKRSTGELLGSETGESTSQILLDPGGTGTIEVLLSPELAGRPCLGSEDLRRLAALARTLEEAFGAIRDVEFGFAGDGSLVVFQVRPVIVGYDDPACRPRAQGLTNG